MWRQIVMTIIRPGMPTGLILGTIAAVLLVAPFLLDLLPQLTIVPFYAAVWATDTQGENPTAVILYTTLLPS